MNNFDEDKLIELLNKMPPAKKFWIVAPTKKAARKILDKIKRFVGETK